MERTGMVWSNRASRAAVIHKRRRRSAGDAASRRWTKARQSRRAAPLLARRLGVGANPVLDALLFFGFVVMVQLGVQPAELHDLIRRPGDRDRTALRARMLAAIDFDALCHGGNSF